MEPTGHFTLGLVGRIREGSEAGLSEFMQHYGPRLLVFINYKLGSKLRGKVEPEDVLQDLFLNLVRDRDSFLEKLDERGVQRTLYRLIENRIKDLYEHFFKTKKRDAHREVAERPPGQQTGGFSFSQLKASTGTYVRRAEMHDEFHRLQGLLDVLEDDEKELFVLKYVEECTNQEMADELGVSISTIKRQASVLMAKVQIARKRRG